MCGRPTGSSLVGRRPPRLAACIRSMQSRVDLGRDAAAHPIAQRNLSAQGRLSLLLALEVSPIGRATADRNEAARIDPADEHGEIRFGARHAFTANCSSSGLRSLSRASPSTWSNDGGRPARDGRSSCVTTRRTLPPWTCSLFQHRFRPALCLRHRPARPQRPRDDAPHYLIRDRDRIYGSIVTRRLRAMGIRDKPTAPASPWQNGLWNG